MQAHHTPDVSSATSKLAAFGAPRTKELDALQRQALDAVSAPLLVHGGGLIIYANPAMLRLLGYDLEQLQSLPHYAWANDADVENLKAYGERCLQQEEALPTLECEAMTATGAVRFLEITARGLATAQGKLVLLSCQDLSDMRHVQMSLLEVGQVMHQILENNPVPTFVIDKNHRITHWNGACAQLTGVAASDVVGSTEAWKPFYAEARPLLVDLIVEGSVAEARERLYGDNLRASSLVLRAYETEDFFPQFGEAGRWIFCTAAPLYDMQGKVVGAIATLLDVTERHLAEEQLRQHQAELERTVVERTAELSRSHRELAAFMENASVGILYSSRHKIIRSNKKFAEIFELDASDPAELLATQFFSSPQAYQELLKIAAPVLSKGQSLIHEMEMLTASGNRIWVQLIAYPANPADLHSGVWWLLQDRSEVTRAQRELVNNYRDIKQAHARLEEAQNQLLQSEKMASIGQLAAGVAHEINNPVGFVSSNLGTLRRYVEPLLQLVTLYSGMDLSAQPAARLAQIKALAEQADLEFIHEDLPQLLKESDEGLSRVKKIVQDLKDFSRVDQADWQEADLNQGLASTLNVVRHEIKYQAEVTCNFGRLPLVRCLAGQLNQVFMNLIINAAHAIAQRGEIKLSTEQVDDHVCVSVQDNGCGMSAEVQRRIFDPFFTTKPVGQGTGLGLSLSFSIVKKHGGRIELISSPGAGSCFKVWLPVRGPNA
ncbi:PAS domain-containing sensor histidine kinase [Roseateles albus]|uniref:histidine kinase n=1 Tax=Roseateles albus TaxID=2987525 RepID=A0ABT5KAF4_9BURK|nr:PAS domain S-box protein [Roseateles albus]MDC8770357.1 PAS domain S-box protein [Roseateles albus]